MSMKLKPILLMLGAALIFSGCSIGSNKNASPAGDGGADTIPLSASGGEEAEGIRLTSPQEGQILKSPFLVGGEARVPGQTVYIKVKKTNGDVLISEQTRVSASQDAPGPFGVLIHFQFQSTEEGIVEVFGQSESGVAVASRSVPVKFDVTAQSNVEAVQ